MDPHLETARGHFVRITDKILMNHSNKGDNIYITKIVLNFMGDYVVVFVTTHIRLKHGQRENLW